MLHGGSIKEMKWHSKLEKNHKKGNKKIIRRLIRGGVTNY